MIRHLLIDVAYTLLDTPELYPKMHQAILRRGYDLELSQIRKQHIALREQVVTPDKPNSLFYEQFNKRLLNKLGLPQSEELASDIAEACRGIEWASGVRNPALDLDVGVQTPLHRGVEIFILRHG